MFATRWAGVVLAIGLSSVPFEQATAAPEPQAASGTEQGLVGTWVAAGQQGMFGKPDYRGQVLEITSQGEFRWLNETAGGPMRTRGGTYTVSGSTVTFRNDTGFGSLAQEFAVKGRTLLLRSPAGGEFGDPYWDYFYRREPAAGRVPIASKSSNILELLLEKTSITGSLTTVTKDFRKQGVSGTYSGTYTTWTLDLKLANQLPFDLDFGNSLIVAQLPEEGLASGFVRVRGADRLSNGLKPPASPHASYMLDDFDSTDGGRTALVGGAFFKLDGSGTHPSGAGFGRVQASSEYVFFEEVNPNRWLKPEAVAGMVVILPEVVAATPAGPERYRIIVSLGRESSAKESSSWVVKRIDVVPIRMEYLLDMLTRSDTTLFRKVLAANWMILTDPQNAARELSKVLEPKSQGSLLAACLSAYAQYGVAGFEKRAAELEYDDDAPAGIQSLATGYLDKLKYTRSDVGTVACAAGIPPNDRGENPALGGKNRLAVRFVAQTEMVIRRVVVELGRSKGAKLSTYSDRDDRPGSKLTEFSGVGTDFRGKQAARAGQAYWFVVEAETIPGWADPYWNRCAPAESFEYFASSGNGGSRWKVRKENASLKTTVYYTNAPATAVKR